MVIPANTTQWPWLEELQESIRPDFAAFHLAADDHSPSASEVEPEHSTTPAVVLATQRPHASRPKASCSELRWLSVGDALRLTGEENVRETIRRISRLLATND